MSAHIEQTIADLQGEITADEAKLSEKKRMVNFLCEKIGQPRPYSESEKVAEATIHSIQRDQWYGQPISGAIREYLTMRRAGKKGPATVNEIYDALMAGGFKFDAKDEENAKRGLRVCLTKNSAIFHRLPDGKTYGLLDWYPEAKNRKAREDREEDEPTDDDLPTPAKLFAPESGKDAAPPNGGK